MINVALIGKGHWGQIYQKTLKKISEVNLFGIYTYNYINEALINKEIDAVIIATPAETHFQITKDALLSGKHVLVEKPFTTNSNDAQELIRISTENNLILQVGHIYLFHDAIIKLKELIDNGTLGDIESVYSKRMSKSKHPNSLWEMGCHDIYTLDYLFDKYVAEEDKAMGDISHCIFNMQYNKILYQPYIREHKINAYVEVYNDYPGKIREIIVNGSEKRAIFDDVSETKLTITYRKNKEVNFAKFIKVDTSVTPLEKQCKHFFDCIQNHEKPISGAFEGFKNVKSLELIEKLL